MILVAKSDESYSAIPAQAKNTEDVIVYGDGFQRGILICFDTNR